MGAMGWSDVAVSLFLGSVCLGCERPGKPGVPNASTI